MTFAAVPECPPEVPMAGSRLPYAAVLAVWAGLFLFRPRLALSIWASRRRR